MKFLDAEGNVLWTQVMDIEWSFTNLEIDMSGGLGYTKVIINGNNEFNYQDSVTNFTLKQLSITQTVKYMNRTWKLDMDSSDNDAIKDWTGFAGADQMTKVLDSDPTNINPYSYSKPTLPESIVMRSTDGNEQETFTEEGKDGYKLEWDLTEFYPSYMGGKTYVYAILTTPSGLTQRLRITLYVQKKLINNISSSGYTSDVNTDTGIAKDPYTITPFSAGTYSLPSAYTVTFTTSSYNGTDFTQVSTTQTMTINYAPVTMPSDFEYAFNSEAKTYLASIKFGSQQRVYVNVTLAAWTTSISKGDKVSGGGNSQSAYVNTMYNSKPVAFIGYAYVEEGKEYKVEISSLETTYYLPKFKGNRAVTYVLVPIFGVMVDKNGTVLTKTTITQSQINTYGLGAVYKEGDTIPYGYGGFGTKFTIVSKN